MDLNIRLIQAKDFLKTTPEGKLDLDRSKQILLKLASECAKAYQYDILIDLRQTTNSLTPFEIADCVKVMIDHRDSFRSNLAILSLPGNYFDEAKFMEMYAENRGFSVRAFRDYEEAMNWLTSSVVLQN